MMLPPAFILWALLAVAAALYPQQSRAQATPGVHVPLSVLVGPEAAAIYNKAGSTVTSSSFGPKVAATYDKVIKDALNRARSVPIKAGVTIPKARVASEAAAVCIAFPARCVGALALGLAAGWAYDALTAQVKKTETRYVSQCGTSTVYTNYFPPSPQTREGCFLQLTSYVTSVFSGVGASDGGPWATEFGPLTNISGTPVSGVPVLNTTYCIAFRYRRTTGPNAGTFGPWQSCGLNFRGSQVVDTVVAPATPADLNYSFTVNSANWQDSTFATVFADAVTKGAKFPITIFDGAEMVAGPQPQVSLGTTTVTGPSGTETQTKTSQAIVTTIGTTVGTAEAVITERVTTVSTGPAGTTTTTTDTSPLIEDNNVTEQPPAEVTVNVEFPPVEFSDTELPAVPDLYEQKYPNGLAGVWAEKGPALMASQFIVSVKSMFPTLSSSGTCPVWAMDLNYGPMGNFGVADLSPPCWIWGVCALILLTTACFAAWRIIFGG